MNYRVPVGDEDNNLSDSTLVYMGKIEWYPMATKGKDARLVA